MTGTSTTQAADPAVQAIARPADKDEPGLVSPVGLVEIDLPDRFRFVAQVFEGVAKPVGGDSEGTVRLVTPEGASDEPVENSG